MKKCMKITLESASWTSVGREKALHKEERGNKIPEKRALSGVFKKSKQRCGRW